MYAIYETWHRRKGQRTCHTLNVGEVRRGREQLRDEENSRTNLPWLDRRLLEKASSRMRSTLNVEQDHLPPRERETERERYFARLTARAFHPEILGDRARRKSGEEKGTDLSLCLSLALELRIPSRQSMKSLFTRVGRDSRSITREPREHDIRKWCVVALLSTDD